MKLHVTKQGRPPFTYSVSTLYFANDHGGVALKQTLQTWAEQNGVNCVNLGTDDTAAVDYPDLAHHLCDKLTSDLTAMGVLICRTGIGMSMAANRHDHVRAAVCTTPKMAHHTRQDNNANVLCLGADLISEDEAILILKTFLETSFLGSVEGGERHQRRMQKISPDAQNQKGR